MIYFKYIRMVLKTMFQYRLNLLLQTIGHFANVAFMFAGIALLFSRFGSLDGWNFGEAALCFAITLSAWSLTECFARGFDVFRDFIRLGTFDRVLLRPRSTIVQVLGSYFEITRLIKLVWAGVVLVIAIGYSGVAWTAMKVLTLVLMIGGGVFIFSGIFILGATVCFWTVEGLEFLNIFTDGGRELASYPMTIYTKWLRRFFTFVIPFGCMNYLPLLYLTDRAANPLYALAPLFGIGFIAPCLLVWGIGVRHYRSTGS
jgi:ABC-2 type transport system permease protein